MDEENIWILEWGRRKREQVCGDSDKEVLVGSSNVPSFLWKSGRNANLVRRSRNKHHQGSPTKNDSQALLDYYKFYDEDDDSPRIVRLDHQKNEASQQKSSLEEGNDHEQILGIFSNFQLSFGSSSSNDDDEQADKEDDKDDADSDELSTTNKCTSNDSQNQQLTTTTSPHPSSSTKSIENIPGTVLVTSKHILFLSTDHLVKITSSSKNDDREQNTQNEEKESSRSISNEETIMHDDDEWVYSPYDFVLNASCITLHAISSLDNDDSDDDTKQQQHKDNQSDDEKKNSSLNNDNDGNHQRSTMMLYCQLEDPSTNDNNGPAFVDFAEDKEDAKMNHSIPFPFEIIFYPPTSNALTATTKEDHKNPASEAINFVAKGILKMDHDESITDQDNIQLQNLFCCISKAIDMTPAAYSQQEDEDEDNDELMYHSSNIGGTSTFFPAGTTDHLLPPDAFFDDDSSSEGATEDERHAMLQRLDDMLVVPPELEIPSDDDEGDDTTQIKGKPAEDDKQHCCKRTKFAGTFDNAKSVPGQFDDADEE